MIDDPSADGLSPYAPPRAEVVEPPLPGRTDREKVDIGEAFNFVFKDPQWLARCGVMGLTMLIPLLGWIMLSGWQARIFARVRDGEALGLPEPDLGGDLGRGLPVFIALLTTLFPLWIAMSVMFGVTFGVLAVLGGQGGGEVAEAVSAVVGMAVYAGIMAVSIGVNLVMPEIYRRGFLGEWVPLTSIADSFADMRAQPGAFFVAVLGWFVAGMLGGMGVYLLCVGWLLTLPMSMAVQAHLAAQWDQVARRRLG